MKTDLWSVNKMAAAVGRDRGGVSGLDGLGGLNLGVFLEGNTYQKMNHLLEERERQQQQRERRRKGVCDMEERRYRKSLQALNRLVVVVVDDDGDEGREARKRRRESWCEKGKRDGEWRRCR